MHTISSSRQPPSEIYSDDTTNVFTEQSPPPSANPTLDIPSDAALFVKNLRFLDLDLLPDWPCIHARTFRAIKDAHLYQKERIRCAEWALFKLFEIWDPVETQTKLDAYFPALEPRQSIKLRGALYQCLQHLKVTGILGRECILRKSTLDECKGEKFEELLFVLSTVVLRKRLNHQTCKGSFVPFTQQLVLANNLNSTEAECLEPLILAHKNRLDVSLDNRRECHRKAQSLERTLQHTLLGLDAKTTATETDLCHYEEAFIQENMNFDGMKLQLRGDCTGSATWLNMIISGDSERDRISLIEGSFLDIWEKATNDEPLTFAQRPTSTLTDLENRMRKQNVRLKRWRDFQKTVSKRNEDLILESPIKSPQKSPRKLPQSSPIKTPRKVGRLNFTRKDSGTTPSRGLYDSTPKLTRMQADRIPSMESTTRSLTRSPTRSLRPATELSHSNQVHAWSLPESVPLSPNKTASCTPARLDMPSPPPANVDEPYQTSPVQLHHVPDPCDSTTRTPSPPCDYPDFISSSPSPIAISGDSHLNAKSNSPPTRPVPQQTTGGSLTERTLATLSRSPRHKLDSDATRISTDSESPVKSLPNFDVAGTYEEKLSRGISSKTLDITDGADVFKSRSRLRLS